MKCLNFINVHLGIPRELVILLTQDHDLSLELLQFAHEPEGNDAV